jgi:hypothetical protein
MTPTASNWLKGYSALTRSPYDRNSYLARALRAAGLFARPSKGRGNVKTLVTAADLVNFILAQAADELGRAAEVVTNLRRMKFRGSSEGPYFGDGDCGVIFERMLEGLPGGSQHSPLVAPRYLPHEIILSTQPFQATMIWRSDTAPGGILRVNTYSQDWPEHSQLVVRKTFIGSRLIEFARQFLNETATETESTSPAREALSGDQSEARATEGADRLNSSDSTPRARAHATPTRKRSYQNASKRVHSSGEGRGIRHSA